MERHWRSNFTLYCPDNDLAPPFSFAGAFERAIDAYVRSPPATFQSERSVLVRSPPLHLVHSNLLNAAQMTSTMCTFSGVPYLLDDDRLCANHAASVHVAVRLLISLLLSQITIVKRMADGVERLRAIDPRKGSDLRKGPLPSAEVIGS
jgi:hypothetical protein